VRTEDGTRGAHGGIGRHAEAEHVAHETTRDVRANEARSPHRGLVCRTHRVQRVRVHLPPDSDEQVANRNVSVGTLGTIDNSHIFAAYVSPRYGLQSWRGKSRNGLVSVLLFFVAVHRPHQVSRTV
jgi:hypothetical protein